MKSIETKGLKTLAALAVAVLLMAPALAEAYPKQGWYVSGAGGVSFQDDSDATIGGVTNSIQFKPGYVVDGSVGYGFENQLRPEFEISYRHGNVDKVTGAGAGSRSGNENAIGLMGNLFYDFDLRTGLTPYLGVGVGGALVSADHAGQIVGGAELDDQQFEFAYQGIAGVSFELSERLDVTADYRYFSTLDPQFSTLTGGLRSDDTTYHTHNFLLGLRYVFGVPHTLPEPVTLRAAPRPVTVIPAPAPVVMPRPVVQAPPMVAPAVPETYIVFFDFDKYYLTGEAKETIRRAADAFKRGGIARVEVSGHTDTKGKSGYNQRLSERRAKIVRDYLVALGVPGDEISTRGAGYRELMVPTAHNVREAKNRRAEIVMRQ